MRRDSAGAVIGNTKVRQRRGLRFDEGHCGQKFDGEGGFHLIEY